MSLPLSGGKTPLKPGTDEYKQLTDAISNDVGFFRSPHSVFDFTSLGAIASKQLKRGTTIFFDRAVCYVDPFLSLKDEPAIRKCVGRLPEKDKRRLNQLFGKGGKDILDFKPQELFDVFNKNSMQLQFPITKDRLHYASGKLISSGRSKTQNLCMTIPSWTPYLFGHSCFPNAVLVPCRDRMKN